MGSMVVTWWIVFFLPSGRNNDKTQVGINPDTCYKEMSFSSQPITLNLDTQDNKLCPQEFPVIAVTMFSSAAHRML